MSKFQVGQEVWYINEFASIYSTVIVELCRDELYVIVKATGYGAYNESKYCDELFATELEAYQQLAKQLGEQSAEVHNRINALEALKRKEAEELLAKEQKAEPRYSLEVDSNNTYKLSVSDAIQLVVITGLRYILPKLVSVNADNFIYQHYEYLVHPRYQIEHALTLARRINAGEKWVIFTHSDYFIRTLNNLMLICDNNLDPDLYGYKANQLFSSKVMLSFEADEHGKLTDYNVNGNEGIECNSIDEVIWDEVDKTRAIIKAVDE